MHELRKLPVTSYLESPVQSRPVRDHHDLGNHDDDEEVGSYKRKLEVVHKEVGGCLISYNLQLACVRKFEVI